MIKSEEIRRFFADLEKRNLNDEELTNARNKFSRLAHPIVFGEQDQECPAGWTFDPTIRACVPDGGNALGLEQGFEFLAQAYFDRAVLNDQAVQNAVQTEESQFQGFLRQSLD